MSERLVPLAEARAYVMGSISVLPTLATPLADALGRVLAQDVVANEPLPPFANTAMDGFAVRAIDTADASAQPVELRVVGTLAAGAAPSVRVGPGEAVRIMTGAPMPPGADAVVMVEHTVMVGAGDSGAAARGAAAHDAAARDAPAHDAAARDAAARDAPAEVVRILGPVASGEHVRAAGEDVSPGQTVFAVGDVLGPGHLGVLASLGVDVVAAVRPARVGVLSTGDELTEGPDQLRPGQIRDANRRSLLALVSLAGGEAVDLGIVRDDRQALTEAVSEAVSGCDALLTSGGVSMGDFDYVKVVLDELSGGSMRWMQVAIRPAKPFAFGTVSGVPVFGLPGNPVSSMVSFECFARPALRKMAGHATLARPSVLAVADEALGRRPDGKLVFARVVASWPQDGTGRCHVRSSGGQGSNLLRSMALANGLALLPDGVGVAPGGDVEVWLLDPLD